MAACGGGCGSNVLPTAGAQCHAQQNRISAKCFAVPVVSGVSGVVAGPPSGPYSASKHAQLAFSRSVAAELKPRGVRVHTILPGFVETADEAWRHVEQFYRENTAAAK